jgi:hypothetical protein
MGAGVSAAATAALTAVMSNPAMALVDERMSTGKVSQVLSVCILLFFQSFEFE